MLNTVMRVCSERKTGKSKFVENQKHRIRSYEKE